MQILSNVNWPTADAVWCKAAKLLKPSSYWFDIISCLCSHQIWRKQFWDQTTQTQLQASKHPSPIKNVRIPWFDTRSRVSLCPARAVQWLCAKSKCFPSVRSILFSSGSSIMSLVHFNKGVFLSYNPARKKLERMEDSTKGDAEESPLYVVSLWDQQFRKLSVGKYQSRPINLLSD